MLPLNWLDVFLLLSAGAFILPALVGGHRRAFAGVFAGGLALMILLYYMRGGMNVDVAPQTSQIGLRSAEERAGDAAAGIPLDPVQFERERAEIERQWQEAELQRRLWHTLSVAGGVFLGLAVATTYLKLDLRTAGRHRGPLRMAAAAAILLATLASAWVWRVPL